MDDKFETENNFETSAEAAGVEETPVKTFNLGKEIFEWVYTIAIALVIAFLIKGFLFDIVRVDGPSMFPTLVHNDRLVITKLGYKPQQGDIIILDSHYKNRELYYENLSAQKGKEYNFLQKTVSYFGLPKDLKHRYYVKRVIAVGGQTVDIQNGKVLVDGKVLEEEYFDGETKITDPSVSYPVTVKEGFVFVMGDNRSNSTDSRVSSLGQVPEKAVIGKSQFRILPLNAIGMTK